MNNKITNFFDKGPILITGHINPDGDALGASFCLKILLEGELLQIVKIILLSSEKLFFYKLNFFVKKNKKLQRLQ